MRGRAAPPHPRIYRVPPRDPKTRRRDDKGKGNRKALAPLPTNAPPPPAAPRFFLSPFSPHSIADDARVFNLCSTITCGPISYINCPFLRYLSTLYSHPEWPNIHPRKVRDELRENVKDNWMWLLLTPSWMYKHVNIILQKKSKGQPVSFTDFFGYLVGDTILKDVSLCSLFQALR